MSWGSIGRPAAAKDLPRPLRHLGREPPGAQRPAAALRARSAAHGALYRGRRPCLPQKRLRRYFRRCAASGSSRSRRRSRQASAALPPTPPAWSTFPATSSSLAQGGSPFQSLVKVINSYPILNAPCAAFLLARASRPEAASLCSRPRQSISSRSPRSASLSARPFPRLRI